MVRFVSEHAVLFWRLCYLGNYSATERSTQHDVPHGGGALFLGLCKLASKGRHKATTHNCVPLRDYFGKSPYIPTRTDTVVRLVPEHAALF